MKTIEVVDGETQIIYICDMCGRETDSVENIDGKDMCYQCLLDSAVESMFIKEVDNE